MSTKHNHQNKNLFGVIFIGWMYLISFHNDLVDLSKECTSMKASRERWKYGCCWGEEEQVVLKNILAKINVIFSLHRTCKLGSDHYSILKQLKRTLSKYLQAKIDLRLRWWAAELFIFSTKKWRLVDHSGVWKMVPQFLCPKITSGFWMAIGRLRVFPRKHLAHLTNNSLIFKLWPSVDNR